MLIHWATAILSFSTLGAAISVKHKYIVEFNDEPALVKRSISGLAADGFHNVLKDHGFTAQPRYDFSFPSFKGATFQVTHRSDPKSKRETLPEESLHHNVEGTLKYLRSLPEVKAAWVPEIFHLHDDFSSGIHATGDENNEHEIWSSLKETNADKVHAMGIEGNGKVIAILDTGVNYSHPALGGGIGEGFKVVGGYNYIDDSSTKPLSKRPIEKTDDPMDCYGHGTMVAGVIAGNSSHIKGVAPQAQIRAYRVFDCNAESSEEILMAALKQAKEDKVDVVNLSLGSNRSWRQLPLSRMASDLVKAGIAVVSSAGNEGYYGTFSAGSFGAGDDVLSVGSLFADELITYAVEAISSGGDTFSFEYTSGNGTQSELSGDIEVTVFETDSCRFDYNSTITDMADSFKSFAVLPKGRCDLETQADELAYLDFTHAMFFSTGSSDAMYYSNDFTEDFEALFSPRSFGQWAIEQKNAGHTVSIRFDPNSPPLSGDSDLVFSRMDNSSSWGPTLDNKFFPSVSAPGGFIYTTDMNGTYTVTRGTSFSAPYVAGIAALFLDSKEDNASSHRNLALEFNSRIISTSKFIRAYDGRRHYQNAQPTLQQGAGIIDALSLIEAKTIVLSEPVLSLNDSRFRTNAFRIQIHNGHDETVNYSTINYPATTVRAKSSNGVPPDYTYPYQYGEYCQASVFPPRFSLKPGESRNVTAVFMPLGFYPDDGMAFSGKLIFAGDNGDSIGVPYMGKSYIPPPPSDLCKKLTYQIGIQTDTYGSELNYREPRLTYTPGSSVYTAEAGQNYTLDAEEYDVPLVSFYLNHGTPELGMGVSTHPPNKPLALRV